VINSNSGPISHRLATIQCNTIQTNRHIVPRTLYSMFVARQKLSTIFESPYRKSLGGQKTFTVRRDFIQF